MQAKQTILWMAQWACMVFDKAEQVKWLPVRASPYTELANYKLSMRGELCTRHNLVHVPVLVA